MDCFLPAHFLLPAGMIDAVALLRLGSPSSLLLRRSLLFVVAVASSGLGSEVG